MDTILSCSLSLLQGEIVVCDGEEKNPELFSHLIGGYGLFGIIYQVTVRVVPNVKLTMQMNKLLPVDFPAFYTNVLNDPTVNVKLGRLRFEFFSQREPRELEKRTQQV